MPRVPGIAEKNTAPDIPPPKKERKNFADNEDEDEQISLFAIWNQAWRFALAMYVRPSQAAVVAEAAAAAMDEFWVSSQTRSIAPAPTTHTHIPPFTFSHKPLH
jgi:hypothetical protein